MPLLAVVHTSVRRRSGLHRVRMQPRSGAKTNKRTVAFAPKFPIKLERCTFFVTRKRRITIRVARDLGQREVVKMEIKFVKNWVTLLAAAVAATSMSSAFAQTKDIGDIYAECGLGGAIFPDAQDPLGPVLVNNLTSWPTVLTQGLWCQTAALAVLVYPHVECMSPIRSLKWTSQSARANTLPR